MLKRKAWVLLMEALMVYASARMEKLLNKENSRNISTSRTCGDKSYSGQ